MALGQRRKHQSEMFVQESAGQGGIEFGIDVCSQSINDIAAAFILLQTLLPLFASSFRLSVFQFRVLGGRIADSLRSPRPAVGSGWRTSGRRERGVELRARLKSGPEMREKNCRGELLVLAISHTGLGRVGSEKSFFLENV